ncbi:MAG: hypothetical protein RIB58_06655 [Phycisphaerales bacterium]
MSMIDDHNELASTPEQACGGACGERCTRCQGASSHDTEHDTEHREDDVDVLTRGLLGSFTRFIAQGDDEDVCEEVEDAEPTPAATRPESIDAIPTQSQDMDDALGRIEQAMAALATAMPGLEDRLASLEERVEDGYEIEWVEDDTSENHDRDAVASSLKDRLAGVQRECDRLASVPIERIETRVAAAERTLGALVERAEAVGRSIAQEREAAERAAERLEALASSLAPWVELLELRESEDGMPRPLAALLRTAGASLAREMSATRESLERFAGVLELPQTQAPQPGQPAEPMTIKPTEEEVVAPNTPDDEDKKGRGRRAKGKRSAVRAKGADAESPRRGASQSRLTAAAKLRARSRAEGRPPRRA